MRIERTNSGQLFLWCDDEEFRGVSEALKPVERVSLDRLDAQGLHNLSLTGFTFSVVAILEPDMVGGFKRALKKAGYVNQTPGGYKIRPEEEK